ncbi:MAG: response regulator [Lachnospiraceae bacterium]|nr:response regulator [Lachnospiraceae bacterium]
MKRDLIKFVIKDTGIGMDESFIPRIFDSFTQEDGSRNNKYGSTGLGMAITKSIVELMNGSVSVESKKGIGTAFTVFVTLRNCEKGRTFGNHINFKDLKVLVVDDEEIAAEHARLVLDEAGIKADISLDGQETLNMLEVAHVKQEHYNLVLLDWKMPEMDGLQAATVIRSLDRADAKKIPIIALTANAFDEDVQRSLQVGMNAHLSKPVEPDRLYQALEELIWEAEN